ncbi:glycoside hydrolase family 130 protein [Rhodothermus profundi]|uniref:Predicted glycosyl hydrolase, GH43/DUF377 family n=1 Tax=Rhodothermus profundi TaxID=633813 RepID=A0A1M6UR35_9BACT|nr:glycosidase [Rhodothermus profundi]SHK71687.1 Predicted glycosyl hydrolase, GH43/DUF377 family [Rhodothermus profundi]
MSLFQRTNVPILAPRADLTWASGAVFNPGAWYDGRQVHLVFRAVPAGYRRFRLPAARPGEPTYGFAPYISSLGYATSTDGVHFTWRETPLLTPGEPFDCYGLEDPRLTFLEGRYWIVHTVLSTPAFGPGDGVRIGLASTTDFVQVEKHGVIGPPVRDKDAALFPRRIRGKLALLHRIEPDIQIVYFRDWEELRNPERWNRHLADLDEHVVLRPSRRWERKKVGVGPPPIETPEGWLLIYHGVDETYTYRAGVALLDLDDPQRVIAWAPMPVLEPQLPFEREGDVPNVVFPEGAVVIDGQLHLYYGAADRVIGHAQAPLQDVVDFVLEVQRRTWTMPRVYMMPCDRGRALRTIEASASVSVERLHGGQPILEPDPQHPWESRVVLNPAAVLVEAGEELERLMDAWQLPDAERERLRKAGGACVMIYRAQGAKGSPAGHAPSSLGLAVLTPMLELVRRWPEPVIRPEAVFHDLGAEDARCTKIGDTYYLFYTGYSSEQPRFPSFVGRVHICLATTQDFVHWELHGPIAGNVNEVDNKNAALLPEPVNGKWLLLHRPLDGRHPMAIHLAEADQPEGPFYSRGLLMASYRYQEFARSWIGAGGPPIALGDQRFLMVYHQGHLDWDGRREYDLAVALLDFNCPRPVTARLEPLMRPCGDAEKVGDSELGVDNVLFACANYVWQNNLIIPYAAADSRIFGARIPMHALIAALHQCSTEELAVSAVKPS